MSFLSGVLGGVVGGQMASVVHDLVEKHGGVQGLVKDFQEHGLGDTVKSWIGTGENKPITSQDVNKVVGNDTLKDLAARAGMTPEELSEKLSHILPQAVDKMTPNGQMV